MTGHRCPCCTPAAPPPGRRLWTTLCDACAYHLHRFQACRHETSKR